VRVVADGGRAVRPVFKVAFTEARSSQYQCKKQVYCLSGPLTWGTPQERLVPVQTSPDRIVLHQLSPRAPCLSSQAANTMDTIEVRSVGAITLSRIAGSCCGCRCCNETAAFPMWCQATFFSFLRIPFGALTWASFITPKNTSVSSPRHTRVSPQKLPTRDR
jgi:hypothetical protein